MHRFGILAHSAEGAALCFTTFCREAAAVAGQHMHPDVVLDCAAMGHSMDAWRAGDHPRVRAILADSVGRLAAAGCVFFGCPDNTAHIALETAGPSLALPGLNIADVVAAEARRRGMTNVAILGTRFTMEGPVYRRALGRHSIGVTTPDDGEKTAIDRIIFEELVEGRFEAESRRRYVEIIARLGRAGCDGVALVCTEIPLLVTPDVSPLPILDSTRLLARAALDVSIGSRAVPAWRGGPLE